MSFVNEYVSAEDVKRYQLDGIWGKYHPVYGGIPSNFRHYWTIDSARNIYFKVMNIGREELSGVHTCLLYLDGEPIKVKVELGDESSGNLNDQPFIIVWHLVGVWPSKIDAVSNKEMIEILKEALTVFGYSGARRQVPNTVVKFKF